ncbi:MAG: hypothetical protein PW792_11685 [Acidobacteriaceae bacterium]|nr:hypothetical protein [Acidobacteriaceae bacterium]
MRPASLNSSRVTELFAAGLFLVYAVILFAHRTPPSFTDFSNWTYQGVLLHNHLLGVPDPAHLLKQYPVPNSANTVGMALLALCLPWVVAVKTWLCLQFLVAFFCLRSLVRAVGAHPAVWIIVPGAVFLNVNLWYGFLNFQLGLCWVLLLAALLLRRAQGVARGDLPVAGLLLLAFFTHMVPFAFCCLLLLLYVWQTERWRTLWVAVPAFAMTIWYVLGRYLVARNADGDTGMQDAAPYLSRLFWAFKVNSCLKSFGLVNPLSADSIWLGKAGFAVLLCANVLLIGILLLLAVRAARRSFAQCTADRFLWLAILSMVPFYLLLPSVILGISDPGARIFQIFSALGIVLACMAGRALAAWAAGASMVLSVAAVLLFVRFGFQPVWNADEHALHAIDRLAHVPNNDQDYFYDALNQRDFSLKVFPTGLFLNTASASIHR